MTMLPKQTLDVQNKQAMYNTRADITRIKRNGNKEKVTIRKKSQYVA